MRATVSQHHSRPPLMGRGNTSLHFGVNICGEQMEMQFWGPVLKIAFLSEEDFHYISACLFSTRMSPRGNGALHLSVAFLLYFWIKTQWGAWGRKRGIQINFTIVHCESETANTDSVSKKFLSEQRRVQPALDFYETSYTTSQTQIKKSFKIK